LSAPEAPDVRFSLANERTFLAYERTAVGLVAAALAVFHLLDPSWTQKLLGILLVASAVVAAGGGWLRYRQADRAIREGTALPTGAVVHVLATAIVIVIVVAGISVVV
jgi:putative membrane protein